MINRARGEVAIEIAGERYRLCLTLGALAEIESGLGAENFADLERRLGAPRVADLIVILEALLRGGGHDTGALALERQALDLTAVARAIAEAFAAAGLGKSQTDLEAPATPGKPQASPVQVTRLGGAGLASD